MAVGRPTKYTRELGEKIASLIGEGATRGSASRSQGICHVTLLEWLKRYPEFASAVTRAEATMLAECAKTVYYARLDDPRMALEILKRREPEEWADTKTLDLTSAGQPLRIVLDLGDSLPGTEADAPDTAEE